MFRNLVIKFVCPALLRSDLSFSFLAPARFVQQILDIPALCCEENRAMTKDPHRNKCKCLHFFSSSFVVCRLFRCVSECVCVCLRVLCRRSRCFRVLVLDVHVAALLLSCACVSSGSAFFFFLILRVFLSPEFSHKNFHVAHTFAFSL